MIDVQPHITAAFEGRETASQAARAIVASGWDFIDPRGKLKKDPEGVRNFLREVAIEIQMLDDMREERRYLFQLVCHSYCHAIERN